MRSPASAALAAALAVMAVWTPVRAQHAHHQAAASAPAARQAAAPAIPSVAAALVGCRPNSFLDAVFLINASVKASSLLAPSAAQAGAGGKPFAAAQAELDSVLSIAVRQAKAELPCVHGKLDHGYDHSYARTMRTAQTYATARKLPAATVAAARQVAESLEQPAAALPKQPMKQ